MAHTDPSNRFVLEVFDAMLWCPIAQVPFYPSDVGTLRTILELSPTDDPEFQCLYCLDDEQIASVVATFATFDPRQLDDHAEFIEIWLHRSWAFETPYLVHTGYELPLLLDDRKKLAWFSDLYSEVPPSPFECEEAFDRWVATSVLHKEVVDEPLDKPVGKWLGSRTVYYTPKGEEWRIPAYKLVQEALGKSGGWNEHFQRLDGMLLGYEDWQNDWWIESLQERGAFGGAVFCCAVAAAGLAWTESAGFRALPPIEPFLPVMAYHWRTADVDVPQLLERHPESTAILKFTVARLYAVPHIIDVRRDGPWNWNVPGHQVPELNTYLKGAVTVVARRS